MKLDPVQQLAAFASPTFRVLRAEQTDVLLAVRQMHTQTPDLAIELPTGSGKTLIALLLAHEVMDRGDSAVYLAPTRQLANQAAEEATRLGLAADVMEAPLAAITAARRRRVNRGETIGIFNYWAYFSEAEVVDPPALLLLDDAHLAEEALAGRYSVVIARKDHPDVFQELVDLFAEHAPGYPVIDDIAAGRAEISSQVQLIVFGDVARLLDRTRPLLEMAAARADNVRYPFRRVSDRLDRCLWFVEPGAITIRPLRFPVAREPRFGDAGRRIYLSATIGNLQDLRRRLGAPPIVAVAPEPGAVVPVPGRRHLLIVDEVLSQEGRLALRQRLASATPRRVWFCRSHREAEEVRQEREDEGGVARILDRDGVAIDWFQRNQNVDLVLAARYDGMDFAYEQGRLAFFPSAPYGTDPFDEFLAANFPRSGFLVRRLAERLTQALGRMTRGDDDWAVCVLESPDLARLLSRRDVINLLPETLAAEVDDALNRADEGLEVNLAKAELVLAGRESVPPAGDWRRPQGASATWPENWAEWEAQFGDGLDAGTHDGAIGNVTRLIEALGDHSLRPWWLYLRAWSEALSAVHDHHIERHDDSLADLGSAVRAAGPTTWFGRVAAMANRMRPASAAAAAGPVDPIVEFCRQRTEPQLQRWRRDVDAGLRSGNHDQVARAWTEVGMALGFRATQPPGGAATDSRWQGSNGIFVFEAKVEQAPGTALARREVNQLLGQIEEERPSGQPTYGAFLTHLTEYHNDVGASAEGLVIFSLDAARELWGLVQAAVTQIEQASRAGHRLPAVAPALDWLEGLFQRSRGNLIGREQVRRAWTRR